MKPVWIAFLLAAALAGTIVYACAPAFPRAVFSYARHPDFPRTQYLSGKLGIFQPTYARSYLVIAYRYLSNHPLSAVEREQVRDYWKDRESGNWDRTATDWESRWQQARKRVPGARALPKNSATQAAYGFDAATNSFFLNCAQDAYRTAAQTLEARGAKFGFQSAALRSWRDAQDTAFANCDGGSAIPTPAAASLPAILRADRDYQIAAAHFYARQYEAAEQEFRRIAASPDSPWNGIAPYLVVRTLARAGKPSAEVEAKAVLANPDLSRVHGMTRVLVRRAKFAERDRSYFHELGRDLASGRQECSLREELWEYVEMFDRMPDDSDPDPTGDDLSDWIHNFQHEDTNAPRHAYARWRRTHSTPWMIAALRHGSGDPDLLAAAAALDPKHPGYTTANFYRLQALLRADRKVEARAQLDRILQLPLPKSSVNAFRGLRMRSSAGLDEFLTFARRMPVMVTTDWNVGEIPGKYEEEAGPLHQFAGRMMFDRDSIAVLNDITPMRLLREAALSGQAQLNLECDFVLSAFTRALILDDAENGLPLAAKLVESGADPQHYLDAYRNAPDETQRRFAGIFYVLHHPEARPYLASGVGRTDRPGRIGNFRDNWWCPVNIKVALDARNNWSEFGGQLPPRERPDPPPFLTQADRDQARAEIAILAKTGSGPDYLINETMRYARAWPNDPRVPEALHYALRAQRYGCVRAQTAEIAENAWRYLWRRYPKSSWTRKSNYNFESENVPSPGTR
jgi:hypothetical protein